LGVLASGNGSNLQAILDAIAAGQLQAKVEVVICNQPDARALQRARDAGVDAHCIPHRDFESREQFDQTLLEALEAAGVEWVVLAGFMRVLTPAFLRRFPHRVINIHPALLPSFAGIHAIRQALHHGVKVTGCTVHLVDEGIDSGPILGQAAVPVLEGDDEATLAARVHTAEHQLFVDTLQRLASHDLIITRDAVSGREIASLRPR
jgi:phosphoribosylglycinamide formyltransferase-1